MPTKGRDDLKFAVLISAKAEWSAVRSQSRNIASQRWFDYPRPHAATRHWAGPFMVTGNVDHGSIRGSLQTLSSTSRVPFNEFSGKRN